MIYVYEFKGFVNYSLNIEKYTSQLNNTFIINDNIKVNYKNKPLIYIQE
jgi:hypothetical protein